MSESQAPEFIQPLVSEPEQPPTTSNTLDLLQKLTGTWTNQNLPDLLVGGQDKPFSYNLMPLPQNNNPDGYILKNFSYYEEITFSKLNGNAPNRGGNGTQVCNTIFYEQRVYFADGPAKGSLVHAENGSFLNITGAKQLDGPYGDGMAGSTDNMTIPGSVVPTQQFNIVKQMSVPHGNSILAVGSATQAQGSPVIGKPVEILPVGVSTLQYETQSIGNLNTAYTENPNKPLEEALKHAPATSYIHISLDSKNGAGAVTNIGFEQEHAKVCRYRTDLWLEAFDGSEEISQLQYSQTIFMDLQIKGKTISFPHLTTNTLRRKTF